MNIHQETYTLNNGVKIPKIAFGTWQIPNEEAYQATADALAVGYRHIDTAKSYHNEEAVGRAIADSGIAREDIFVTTKLRAPALGYQETLDAFDAQLKELGLSYLDLYIIHAPWPWNDRGNTVTAQNIQAWKAMEDLVQAGKVKAIGVSNFEPSDLQAILDICRVKPMINQIRFSVGYTQAETVHFCETNGILIEAYSPLATGGVFENATLQALAMKKGVSVAQICLRYCLDKGTLPLPKTRSKDRMIQNASLDFELLAEDIQVLDSITDMDRG